MGVATHASSTSTALPPLPTRRGISLYSRGLELKRQRPPKSDARGLALLNARGEERRDSKQLMCGINGIYSYKLDGPLPEPEELLATSKRMHLRGPDASGLWWSDDRRLGLAHRRLSIIDLSDRAAQPMRSVDGRYIISFNGEIYNYRPLRAELEANGYFFKTTSDTEVLLNLFMRDGAKMLGRLRGMFAFAIWDTRERILFLARDPYGIKPLYVCNDGATLRFGSQVKALLAGGRLSKTPDPRGWVGYYLFGSVPEPYTIYDQIRSLPAGSYMTASSERGVSEPTRFFSIAEVYRTAEQAFGSIKPGEFNEFCREALLDSVRAHLVADVPVGAFLSAGVDSSAVVGLMRDAGQSEIHTVTLGFREFASSIDDEVPIAEDVARAYDTRHSTIYISETEFKDDFDDFLYSMDQPSIDGLNTWLVSKQAHLAGMKVALSGLGGDELFGGYPSFRHIPHSVKAFRALARVPAVGKLVRKGAVRWGVAPKLASLLELGGTYSGAYMLRRAIFLPWELPKIMDPEMAAEGLAALAPMRMIDAALDPLPNSDFSKVGVLEASFYMRNQLLRDADWASMAHSLEVRVPFVDSELLRHIAASMPMVERSRKQFLALAPSKSVSARVLHRKKKGFNVPIGRWLVGWPRLDEWKRIPELRRDHCHWSRRWAYSLAEATAA
jgi:asparagine synthase (glutamine-hydrolysing)